MSSEPKPTEEQLTSADEKLFVLLERYVQVLHDNDIQSRSVLLERHPELAELLNCLDDLDSLAPLARVAVSTSLAEARTITESPVSGEAASEEHSADKDSADAFTVFGKYELLGEIGRGGMGVVYQARQRDLDRTVAVKMILANRLASEDDVRRFYAEAKAAGSLMHSNIVSIHEVGEIHGQHYFAMDYVQGPSLFDVLRTGPMDADAAAECLSAVAGAVDYLHQHNIVHRDLKPSNILLDDSGTPYVTDFGLAKVFAEDSEHTQTGTIIGTPSYMAPEQAAGRTSQISPQSDVYSLGAILYETLTGRPPFKQNSPLDTLVDVLEGEPTLPSRLNRFIPRELELICLRCLEKDPQKRYPTAAALSDDLERFRKREPIEARSAGILQTLRRWVRREPALVSRLCGLLLSSAIVQLTYLWDPGDGEFHVKIMSLFAAWAIVAFVLQRLLHRDRIANAVRFIWSAADTVLLTLMLLIAREPIGELLIGYPLLVTASGLFFRVRLVWFMTFATLVSFAVLLLLRPEIANPPHYPVLFAAVLVVLGVIVAYQVYRVRVLSRYYEHRRLP